MSKSIIQIELRKVLPVYLASLTVIAGYILFWTQPLMSANMLVLAGAFLQGYSITWLLFYETPPVESFLFSRGFTRQTLFWHRWTIAVGLTVLTLLIVAALIGSGLRCLIFQNGPWHPMVKWYELNILWPLGLAGSFGVSLRMFLLLRDRYLKPDKTPSRIRLILKYLVMAALLVCLLFVSFYEPDFLNPQLQLPVKYNLIACLYAVGLLALSTAAGRSCFLRMEIQA